MSENLSSVEPNTIENHAPESESDALNFEVLLYYHYFPLADAEAYFRVHRDLCQRLALRGRVLIGSEGLNGTVSGPKAATEIYRRILQTDPRTAAMDFKIDPSEGHVFRKLSVKLRPEIVTLGLSPEEDIDPNQLTGQHLKPEDWAAALEDPDAVIIDGRNNYESAIGHFHGAICPDIDNFRDFPAWLREHADELRGKKILTYCTGGIRCEKLSGFLLKEGFDQVYQLEGGIVSYGKNQATRGRSFDGLCYVFDERVAVEVNQTDTHRIVSRCRHCDQPSARYRNCRWAPCNDQIFLCESCEETFGKFCSESCREKVAATAIDTV
ncbi:MAG: rhodanese-related sulfurtransferase [Verrucomicrobiae bacterium]|nr:rhodanese-related sulfurtransferase [Verrucomicrobiae bacterium]